LDKPRRSYFLTLMSICCLSAVGCSSAHNHAQVHSPRPAGKESLTTVTAPTNWYKVDAGPFSILAPPGWGFHQLEGVDSYVGELVGDGVALTFDFGRYSNSLKEERKPVYVVIHKSIGGRRAKIVSPRTPGHGITGAYFRNVVDSNALALFGHDLTSTQQELVLKIFETLRFGGPLPRYVLPPPPPTTERLGRDSASIICFSMR
jgi:hypothetical protein